MRPATSPFGTRIDSLTCPTNSNTVQNGSFFSHQTQFSSQAGFSPLSSAWPPWFLDICVVSHIGLAAGSGSVSRRSPQNPEPPRPQNITKALVSGVSFVYLRGLGG